MNSIVRIVQAFEGWFFSKSMLRWWILGLAVLGIGVSAAVIVWISVRPGPPDPEKTDVKTAVKFTQSQDFLDMTSKQRSRYVESLVKRYAAMDPRDRTETAGEFRRLRRENPKGAKLFLMTLITKRSEQYHKLPPDQRPRYIDNLLDKMELLGGSKRMKKRFDQNFSRKTSRSSRKESLERNQKHAKLLLEKTSAEERAKMSRTTGDVIKRLRSRYDE